MRKWLIFAFMTLATAASAATYKWTDANGQVHYSDRPMPGAVEIDLRPAQGYAPPAGSLQVAPAADTAPAEAAQPYTRIEVVSPAQQETLWNIEGDLPVQVMLEPALQAGHRFGVYLNGQLIDLNATSPQLVVPEVYRGAHSLQAVVLDARGTPVVRSLAVMFQVMQTSLMNPNNPNNAPAAQPPAVPRPMPVR
jgi:hypothetical protein